MTNEKKIELIRFLDEKGYVVEGISDEDNFNGYRDDLKEKKELNRVKVLIYSKSSSS